MDKETFINKEFWFLTTSAAFQRANIYKGNVEDKKTRFKEELYDFISGIAEEYLKEVNETTHLMNIHKISNDFKPQENILKNGKLNFGICQKLLNLHLKYLWCLGKIPTPPHFPVDRRIQEKMRIEVSSWTNPEFNEKDYIRIIEHSKVLTSELEFKNIAEFELFLFNYEGDIKKLRKSITNDI